MEFSSTLRFTSKIPENSYVILDCYHDWPLVAVATLLGCLTALTAMALIEHVTCATSRASRHGWAILAAVGLGSGIWSMHFTAMAAFRAPMPVAFDVITTLQSLCIPILLSYAGLVFYGVHQSPWRTVGAGLLLGAGALTMHFVGMSALVMPATLYFNPVTFSLSVLVAAVAGIAVLETARFLFHQNHSHPLLARALCSAGVGGLFISMHFVAMSGMQLISATPPAAELLTISGSAGLSGAIAAVCGLILMLGFVAGASQRRLREREEHLREVRNLVKNLEHAREKLQDAAMRDPVTRLGNRHSLNLALDEVTLRNNASGKPFSLLFVDIDDFKRINDSLGHASGDLLLAALGQRLANCLRPNDQIARFGGDEFVIMLEEESSFRLQSITTRILRAMQRPYELPNQAVSVGISIGGARFPQDGASASEILRSADTALYHAKALGKNRYAAFDETMHNAVNHRLQLESELRRAISDKAIEVHFQPIACTNSGTIACVEALARWTFEGKPISPAEFIPLAEQNGTIIPLGRLIIDGALAGLRSLRDAGFTDITLAINLSAMQFKDTAIVTAIERRLRAYELPGSALRIEITESSLIDNLEYTNAQLSRLKALGVAISIDDFGIGYSSLSCLKKLPIDEIKIDQSFVRDIPADEDDVAIVEAIMEIAHKLRLTVVAEGIEHAAQAEFFRNSRRCQFLQGYLLGRPQSLQDLLQNMAQRPPTAREELQMPWSGLSPAN